MNLSRLLSSFRYTRVLKSPLRHAECLSRIGKSIEPPKWGEPTRPFVGHVQGDRFSFGHAFVALSLRIAELNGTVREDRGQTIVECRIGLPIKYVPGLLLLAYALLFTLFMIIRAAIGYAANWLDVVIIVMQLTIVSALAIGLIAFLMRDAHKNGDTLFRHLRDILEGTELTRKQPSTARST